MAHIVIVEDEEKLRLILKKYLEAESYTVELISEGTDAVDTIRDVQPNLLILDIMLPGKSGIEICKEVRQFSQVPIIMTTAKVEEIDILLGLELGADDYVCKPYSPRQVTARVKAMLRRANSLSLENPATNIPENGQLILDASCYSAMLDGKHLDLTPVEFRILQALYGPPARVLNRNQLMDKMYDDYRSVSDRTVDSHVANLRKKLKSLNLHSDFIQPVYGVGYRYVG
ncbi:MAG: response regulator [Acidiferrobacterales bacterium]|nr:response regulator [Acidiferrobacterales bacterium]